MIWLQIFLNGQQNTLLTLVVVMPTLVPLEVVATTIPAITQATAAAMLPLTALATLGLGSAYICRTER